MDPVKMNINLEDTTEITCDECGSATFHEAVVLRSISRFITGTAQNFDENVVDAVNRGLLFHL